MRITHCDRPAVSPHWKHCWYAELQQIFNLFKKLNRNEVKHTDEVWSYPGWGGVLPSTTWSDGIGGVGGGHLWLYLSLLVREVSRKSCEPWRHFVITWCNRRGHLLVKRLVSQVLAFEGQPQVQTLCSPTWPCRLGQVCPAGWLTLSTPALNVGAPF